MLKSTKSPPTLLPPKKTPVANSKSEFENSARSARAPDPVSHQGGHAELPARDSPKPTKPSDALGHAPQQKEPNQPEQEQRPDSSHEVVIEKPDKATDTEYDSEADRSGGKKKPYRNSSDPIWVDDPAKAELFQYLLTHDFREEVDLDALLDLEFELTPEEDLLTPSTSNILKLLKILFYRTGITTHRQDTAEDVLHQAMNKKLKEMDSKYVAFLASVKDA